MSARGIDWGRAERVANWVASRRPAPTAPHPVGAFDLASMAGVARDRVEDVTGLRGPDGPVPVRIVDRAEWIHANLESLQAIVEPLFDRLAPRSSGRPRSQRLTAQVAGAELGALLGAMAARVLGQYDLLLRREQDGVEVDAVYLVGPNLAAIEQRYGFDPEDFRMWVLLHELTHRAQFTGVPWLREHFGGLIDESLALVEPDPQRVLAALRDSLRDRSEARARVRDGGVVSLVASPEQRAVMRRIGGLMSLLEGHGEVTMDRAAVGLVAGAPRFGQVLRARRRRASPVARLVQRLVGLEAKLEQYAAGERFVHELEAHGGRATVDLCWTGPEHLPTLDEIRHPTSWLARMEALVA